MGDIYEVNLYCDGKYFQIHLNEDKYYEFQRCSLDTAYLNNLIQSSVSVQDISGDAIDDVSKPNSAILTGIVDGDTGEYINLGVSDSDMDNFEYGSTPVSSRMSLKSPMSQSHRSQDSNDEVVASQTIHTPITSRMPLKRPVSQSHRSQDSNDEVVASQTIHTPITSRMPLKRPVSQSHRSQDNNEVTLYTNKTTTKSTINQQRPVSQPIFRNPLNIFFSDGGNDEPDTDSRNHQSQSVEKKRKTKVKLCTLFEGELLDEAEAFFLGLVFKRPLLFDYTLPIEDRNPLAIADAWDDVRDKMHIFIRERVEDASKITVDVLKDTWLNLRTAYMRYKNGKKRPSGSSPTKTPQIKHLDLLSNYDTVANKRATQSTLDDEDYDVEYANQRPNECIPPKSRRGRRGGGRGGVVNDDFLNVAKKVLQSVSTNLDSTKSSNPPSPAPTTTSSNSRLFAESLIHDLDLLNAERLSSAKMRISQVVYDEINKQNN